MYAPRYDDTFWPKGKRCPVSSLPRPFLITSRDLNEARRPHTCCRPCAFEEQKSNKTKTIKNTHCPKHNTISTAAWRPQPPRDGARRDTFYALAHILPLHRSFVCGNRPRTALAIAYGKKRPRSLRSLGLFFYIKWFRKKERKPTPSPHQQSSQRPPNGIPLVQSCNVTLDSVSDPLGAMLWYGLGRPVITSEQK